MPKGLRTRERVESSRRMRNILLGTALCAVLFVPRLAANQTKSSAGRVAQTAAKQTKTRSGLIYETVVKGTGAVAKRGDKVRIHETLSLPDGRVIFNSRDKNQTVTFVLGANQVIAGVDEGVTGMRVGERRKLFIPPSLDGRTFDPSFIPPDAIRHYDIELVEIVKRQP
jgi:FKBP-type peptidyl-prolyl cis-trans isomerase